MKTYLKSLLFLLPLVALAGNENWNTPTSSGQFRWEETEGILTVQSGGDVFGNGELLLRSTTRIVFQPGFRAYTNSKMRAGIDTDLDGFTEADVDGDGIPDHYESEISGLDIFDSTDFDDIDPNTGQTYYDTFHLNLNHQYISTGSLDFRAPFANDLFYDFNIDDNGAIDTTINEYFGHYNGDGIKDYYAEVTQYDAAWSTPFYYSAYASFNGYTPYSYRIMDGYGGPLSSILSGTQWGLTSFSWGPYVTYDVRYDVVRFGKESEPWQGGSYNKKGFPNYHITPVVAEVTTKYPEGIIVEVEVGNTDTAKSYGITILESDGVRKHLIEVLEGTGSLIVKSGIYIENGSIAGTPVIEVFEVDYGNIPTMDAPQELLDALCSTSEGQALIARINNESIPIYTIIDYFKQIDELSGVTNPRNGDVYISLDPETHHKNLESDHKKYGSGSYQPDLVDHQVGTLYHEIQHHDYIKDRIDNDIPRPSNEEAKIRKDTDDWLDSAGYPKLFPYLNTIQDHENYRDGIYSSNQFNDKRQTYNKKKARTDTKYFETYAEPKRIRIINWNCP